MTIRHPPCLAAALACLACWAAGVGASAQGDKKAKFTPTAAEARCLELINEARKEAKLPALKVHPLLTKVAREHSANMAAQGKLEHILDGKPPSARLKGAGYAFIGCGENIYWGRGEDVAVVTDAHTAWLNSPGHRDNSLGKAFSEAGVGLFRDEGGKVYVTLVVAVPARR